MAVKIIRPGIKPKDIVFEVECRHCTTVFQFARGDAETVYDRTGDFLRIKCPFCKQDFTRGLP